MPPSSMALRLSRPREPAGKQTRARAVDGAAAHRIDVREGVGRGDAAEEEGIVHDGRKEIDGLDQGEAGADAVEAGILAAFEGGDQVGISRLREAAEGLFEEAGAELGPAAGEPRQRRKGWHSAHPVSSSMIRRVSSTSASVVKKPGDSLRLPPRSKVPMLRWAAGAQWSPARAATPRPSSARASSPRSIPGAERLTMGAREIPAGGPWSATHFRPASPRIRRSVMALSRIRTFSSPVASRKRAPASRPARPEMF